MKVTVFCNSSVNVSPMLLSEAEGLGEWLAREGHTVIYGGLNTGCMGALAKGVRRRNGPLIGVLTAGEHASGLAYLEVTEQHVMPTRSLQKTKMIELGDAFIVFPGGIGTLDEAFEVLGLKANGDIHKKIIFYNFLDIWSPWIEALELAHQQRLVRQPIEELLLLVDKRESIGEHLVHGV